MKLKSIITRVTALVLTFITGATLADTVVNGTHITITCAGDNDSGNCTYTENTDKITIPASDMLTSGTYVKISSIAIAQAPGGANDEVYKLRLTIDGTQYDSDAVDKSESWTWLTDSRVKRVYRFRSSPYLEVGKAYPSAVSFLKQDNSVATIRFCAVTTASVQGSQFLGATATNGTYTPASILEGEILQIPEKTISKVDVKVSDINNEFAEYPSDSMVKVNLSGAKTIAIDTTLNLNKAFIVSANQLTLVGDAAPEDLAKFDFSGVSSLDFACLAVGSGMAINFGSGYGSLGEEDEAGIPGLTIYGKCWNNVSDATGNVNAKMFGPGGASDISTTMAVSWKSKENYSWDGATSQYLKGYIDDGSGVSVNATVPFGNYDLYIITATDFENTTFSPKTINGIKYTVNTVGDAIPGTDGWGSTHQLEPFIGQNIMVARGLTARNLAINSARENGRGCIAAIIIVKVDMPAEAIIEKEDVAISDINAELAAVSDDASALVTLVGAKTLVFDTTLKCARCRIVFDGVLVLKGTGYSDDFDKYIFGGVVVREWLATMGVININLNSGNGKFPEGDMLDDRLLAGNTPKSSWINTTGAAGSLTDITEWRTLTQESAAVSDMIFTWDANTTWYANATIPVRGGYLDDGKANGVTLTLSGVPYEMFDVIVYFSTDQGGGLYQPMTVNGTTYTGDMTTKTTIIGNATWGDNAVVTSVEEGVNALRVCDLAGDVTIHTAARNGSIRGCVAAIQIVEVESKEFKNVYTAEDENDVLVSDINQYVASGPAYAGPVAVYLKGGNLIFDESFNYAALAVNSTGDVLVKGDGSYRITDADREKVAYNDIAGDIILNEESPLPTVAPGEGKTYVYSGMVLPTIPFNNVSFMGTLVIDCEVDKLASGDDGMIFNTKNIVFGENFSCEDANLNVVFGNQGGQTQRITQKGGSLTLKKDSNGAVTKLNALTLAHWGGNVYYDLIGGSINVPNDKTTLGWDGAAHLIIGGGTSAATLTTKGIATGQSNNPNELTIGTNGVLSVGAYGANLKSSTTVTLNGGTLEAYDTATFAAANANGIQVTADSTIEVPTDVTLTITSAMSGDGVIAKTGAGTLVLGSEARPNLGTIGGKVRFIVSAEETADGEIVVGTSETVAYGRDLIEVKDADGKDVEIKSIIVNNGQLTIGLPKNTIESSSKVSEWDPMTGEVAIKAKDPTEEIVITVDQAFSSDISAINVFGKVKFVFNDEVTASSAIIKPVAGAEVTITGPLQNEINPAVGSKIFIDGEVTQYKKIRMASGIILTVNPNATLRWTESYMFTGDDPTRAHDNNCTRTFGTFNIYGIFDLDAYVWQCESLPANCTINFYAGSAITGTTGKLAHGGGSNPAYNLKSYDEATSNLVTIGVARGNTYGAAAITLNTDDGLSVKILKPYEGNKPTAIVGVNGATIAGLELAENAGLVKVTGSLGGKVIVGAGSTLELGAENVFVTEGDAPAELAIAGTLNCGEMNQNNITEFNITNNMTIANGKFPAATMTVKEGVTLTVTGTALDVRNLEVNGAVNGAIEAGGKISGTGSITEVTLGFGSYIDATAGALTITRLNQGEDEPIVIMCKTSGGELIKGLASQPVFETIYLYDSEWGEISEEKGKLKFSNGTLSFSLAGFLIMLK